MTGPHYPDVSRSIKDGVLDGQRFVGSEMRIGQCAILNLLDSVGLGNCMNKGCIVRIRDLDRIITGFDPSSEGCYVALPKSD